MLRLFTRKKSTSSMKPANNLVSTDYGRLLNDHLDYIAKVCERAVDNGHTPFHGQGKMISGEGGYSYIVERAGSLDADDLFVQVLDHLKEDKFRRLRDFQGRSSITTYLTSIITRFVIDVVRSRSGRSRAKERAAKLGTLGERVYDLMVLRSYSAREAAEIMQTTFGQQISPDELSEIHTGLLGRETRYQSSTDSTTAWNEDGELVAIQSTTPERELSDRIQQKRRSELLAALMENLKVEDRLLLRLRFPLDDEAEPLEMSAIAAMMGLNEQQAERKLRRILVNCREELLKKGFSLKDLL